MAPQGFSLFETAIGHCGVAWSPRGLVGVQLPEGRPAATRARMRRRWAEADERRPPKEVRAAVDAMVSLLAGRPADLSGVALDMDGVPTFHQRVYEVARTIPAGQTRTYGEIAAELGAPGTAQAVGQALGRNPFAIVVPCHRVVAAGGKTGGFSAKGGVTTKLRILAIEGARAAAAQGLFDVDDGGEPGFDAAGAVDHLRAVDPILARTIDRCGPFELRVAPASSAFVALAEAIVYQQLHAKAAATIFARVGALFPRTRNGPRPEQILRASDDELRGAGLSRAKMLALRDLAQHCVDGEIPPLGRLAGMDDDEIVERLTAVRGIGRWTAEMFLIFRLGRPDVLPVDDYGVRQGFALALGLPEPPSPKELAEHGERWRPYRSVASSYLWQLLDLTRNETTKPR
jgi:O-6-methylguanine DNA methyltransferase